LAVGEAATLLAFLDYQRATLAWKCAGLDDAHLRATLHPTSMTLAGLLKHLARVEDKWFSEVVGEAERIQPWADMAWAAEWDNCSADSGQELRTCGPSGSRPRVASWPPGSTPAPLRWTRRTRPAADRAVHRCAGSWCT